MARLPKSIIRKYGITKKAWRVFRGRKTTVRRRRTTRRRAPRRRRSYTRRIRRGVRRRVKDPILRFLKPIKKHAYLGGVAVTVVPSLMAHAQNPAGLISHAQGKIQEIASNPMSLVTKITSPAIIQPAIASVVLGVVSKFIPSGFGKVGSMAKQITKIGASVTGGVAVGMALKETLL